MYDLGILGNYLAMMFLRSIRCRIFSRVLQVFARVNEMIVDLLVVLDHHKLD